MASIQEQLKHIRSANDDWTDDHRLYDSVSPVYINKLIW